MVTGSDPTADLNRLMDDAGLNGSLLTQKAPFMVGIVNVRMRLARALADYINQRETEAAKVARTNAVIKHEIQEDMNG